MEITLFSLLALLTLLIVACLIYLLSQKIKLPYTVLLVATGLILVPVTEIPGLNFLQTFTLTPELLFYIFLPALLFESAYNMDIRTMVGNIRSISLLAVVGLLISTALVGFGIYTLFPFIGYTVPLMVALLFGALISSTDPVAVLALFKEYGAPKRLALIFEGESVFNDGTAMAVFIILLEIARVGFSGVETVFHALFMFTTMVLGGIIAGLVLGTFFSKAIEFAKQNEAISITLTLVTAYVTFLVTEVVSSHLSIGGVEIKLSPIIATVVAALVIGNYGRYKIGVRAQEFVEKFWGQIAFLANSIVFLLVGLLFANLPFEPLMLIVPIVGAIIIVATARALSIYIPIIFLNWTRTEEYVPWTWQHLLAWGSLRGALAITLVLIIPDSLTFPGWEYSFSPKDFIMALTIGCIYTTLFVKATTIGPLMKALKINDFSTIEKREYSESRALIHATVLKRIEAFAAKGYIDTLTYVSLKQKHEAQYQKFIDSCVRHNSNESAMLSESVLRLYALGIEKFFLKELLVYGEVTEHVFKKILGKLTVQLECAEKGICEVNWSTERDPKDIFENMAHGVRKILGLITKKSGMAEKFMYYRAQSIIASKVIKELGVTHETYGANVFSPAFLEKIIGQYTEFRNSATAKMQAIARANPEVTHNLFEQLAQSAVFKVEEQVLEDLKEREMITAKIYIALHQELVNENR